MSRLVSDYAVGYVKGSGFEFAVGREDLCVLNGKVIHEKHSSIDGTGYKNCLPYSNSERQEKFANIRLTSQARH
ncbi:MAG: hypothetical protein II917_00170, partial [Synergistaceae bacterium]|nr:hypothetical protein [Synergistaceae bacterium]